MTVQLRSARNVAPRALEAAQAAPAVSALPAPPDAREKYSYAERNLTYLTTTLVIGTVCLIVSQARFEAQGPVAWPFLACTLVYVI
jgi:cellulose synthase (UDP-forming)